MQKVAKSANVTLELVERGRSEKIVRQCIFFKIKERKNEKD
jgi:hypothetical protein